MKTKGRWDLAQHYEKNWWISKASELDLEFYERFANDMLAILQPYLKIEPDTYILEIGSGAAGIITYLKSSYRFAIDPLENIYSSIEKFTQVRDKQVKYFNIKAEEIPFENNFFDLIIMDNVLDHCEDPEKVFTQIQRVTKPGGIIYFRQNTYHAWGKFIRSVIELLKIDKGHPFSFSKSELRKSFSYHRLSVLYYKESGYLKTWLKEIKSRRFYDKIKAVLFATRDKTTFVLRKD